MDTTLQVRSETERAWEQARRYARNRCNWHKRNGGYRCHWSFAVLHALEDTLRKFPDLGYGVEGDTAENGEGHITIEYINTGDTYATTLVHYRGKFRIASWGDCVEDGERRHGTQGE